jgi:hypothetical protein
MRHLALPKARCKWDRSRVSNGTRAFLTVFQFCYTKFVKFYYIYVLYNLRKNFIYIGYSENLE